MEISNGLIYSMLTVETAGRSIRSFLISSAIAFKLLSSESEASAIVITLPLALNALTIGFSVSLGKVVIASTLPFMSFSARLRSAPLVSCNDASQPPSLAVLVMRSISSAPSSASSIRKHTPDSDSSGVAPR